jgi:hypothetical protein
MLSPPSGPHGPGPDVPQDRQRTALRVRTVVAAVRLRGSLMELSTPAAPKGGRLLR